MAISQATVGTSATTLFTSVGNNATTAMFFMNDNASTRQLTVFVVKSGGTAGAANTITKAIDVTPIHSLYCVHLLTSKMPGFINLHTNVCSYIYLC